MLLTIYHLYLSLINFECKGMTKFRAEQIFCLLISLFVVTCGPICVKSVFTCWILSFRKRLCFPIFSSRLADLRQHLRGRPVLEHLGLWQLRREHQRIESVLVNDYHSRFIGSVANRDGAFIFLVHVLVQCIAAVLIPQRLSHVFTYETGCGAKLFISLRPYVCSGCTHPCGLASCRVSRRRGCRYNPCPL